MFRASRIIVSAGRLNEEETREKGEVGMVKGEARTLNQDDWLGLIQAQQHTEEKFYRDKTG